MDTNNNNTESLLHLKQRHNSELILMSRNFKNSDPKNDSLDPFLFVIHNSLFNFEDLPVIVVLSCFKVHTNSDSFRKKSSDPSGYTHSIFTSNVILCCLHNYFCFFSSRGHAQGVCRELEKRRKKNYT